MSVATSAVKSAALQRCLNSPYLSVDESKRGQAGGELQAARDFYQQALASFNENDEATGLKQSWAAMFRAARALAYKAGYRVDQLRCLEVVLQVHYAERISAEDIADLQRAQELLGPPKEALDRAKRFLDKAAALA